MVYEIPDVFLNEVGMKILEQVESVFDNQQTKSEIVKRESMLLFRIIFKFNQESKIQESKVSLIEIQIS